jgi:hypothetical protein
MPLVTRVFAASEHVWDPMASSSVNFCRKTRTVLHCVLVCEGGDCDVGEIGCDCIGNCVDGAEERTHRATLLCNDGSIRTPVAPRVPERIIV